MINEKIDKTLLFIDLDPKLLLSILKKYIIHLIIFTSLISTLIYLASLNLDKKFKSTARIVIEPDDKNIVNIQEYRNFNQSNRINNQIAMFKSDQVLEYIINDKENLRNFEIFFLKIIKILFKDYSKKKKNLILIL